MALPPPILFSPTKHSHLISQLVQIHADSVIEDGTMATFLPNFNGEMDTQKLIHYWNERSQQVTEGSRDIIMQFTDSSETELMGYVSLNMPFSETGPFRSLAEKLCVSPGHRCKGVARRVIAKLEEVAREKERGLVVLDITIGSGAEFVYPKLGYMEFGIVPKYGIHPLMGKLADEMFFYKDLREL